MLAVEDSNSSTGFLDSAKWNEGICIQRCDKKKGYIDAAPCAALRKGSAVASPGCSAHSNHWTVHQRNRLLGCRLAPSGQQPLLTPLRLPPAERLTILRLLLKAWYLT